VFIYAFQASILLENNENPQKHAKNNPFYSQFIPKQTLSYPINSRIYQLHLACGGVFGMMTPPGTISKLLDKTRALKKP
jgi:hypothetical protein